MHELIKEKTIYGITFKVIEDNIKVDKDFQIPLIEDRAFRYMCCYTFISTYSYKQ